MASLGTAVLDLVTNDSGLRSGLSSALSSAQGFGKAAGAALLGVGAAGLAAGGLLAKMGIDMNSTLETSTLQFQTLMGDADQAREHVKFLFQFAKDTPFETEPILKASRALQTFGGTALNNQHYLELVGDAAAAASVNIDEVGFWFGRAYAAIQAGQPFGEAAARLQEMGLLGPEASAALQELQKNGGTAAEKMAVLEGALGKFGGAMKLQANTFQGLWSSLTDSVSIAAAKAFAPFFEVVKSGMSGVLDLLSSDTFDQFTQQAADIMQAVGGILTLFTSTDLDATTEAYARLFNVFGEDVAHTILLVSQAVTGLFGAFQGDTAGMEQAQRALNELFGPEVIATAQQVGTAIKGAFDQIVGALSPFVTQQDLVVAGIIAISAVIVATAVPALLSLVASAAPVVLAIGAIVAVVALARTAWENDWGGIQEKTQAVFEAIGPIFNAVIAYLGEQLTPLIEALGPAWEAIWPAMQQAFETWWSVVSPIFETVKNVLSIVIPLALVTLKTTFENQIKLITTALELVPPAIDLIQTAFQTVADFINGLHIANPFQPIIDTAERAKALIGGGGGGGGTPTFEGGTGAGVGTRAEGGPVSAGLPYLVGEKGPELFTPNGNGSITPNGALGGIQVGSYQQVLNVGPGADVDAVRQAAADGFAEGMRRLIASARTRQVVPEGA